MKIAPIKAYSDNYIWCLHNDVDAVLVDPGCATSSINFLQQNKLNLNTILVTHHHYDHTDGIPRLLEIYPNALVYGPCNSPKEKLFNQVVSERENINLKKLHLKLKVLATKGHTLDHIIYYNDNMIFSGDTLFSLGCGRLFEGDYSDMFDSLNKIKNLSPHAHVYAAHEYTLQNLKFAMHLNPTDPKLNEYLDEIKSKDITLPSTLSLEKSLNPFLKAKTLSEFTHIRKLKDNF